MTSLSLRRCLLRNVKYLRRSYEFKNYSKTLSLYQFVTPNFTKSSVIVFQPRYNYVKYLSTHNDKNCDKKTETVKTEDEEPKPGLIKRFKQMYRDYWYVLVPVHLVTSASWFCGFYYLAKSGIDVVALLQNIGFSEKLTNPLKDSSMGYLAISYALYKIATPLRYTVTIGGTTLSINYLKNLGYIKPVPSKDKLKEMYIERKQHIRETLEETKEELRQRKDQLKERKDNIMGDYVNFKKELKDIKTKKMQNTLRQKILPCNKGK